MKIQVTIALTAVLVMVSGIVRADIVLRVQNTEALINAGEVRVGVFALSDASFSLGAYDIPTNFGGAGPTVLPSGISFTGVTNSIIATGGSLNQIADPLNLGDIVVSDAVIGSPPVYPMLVAGVEAKLFDLQFNVGAAALGSQFSITPLTSHLFFNVNNSTSQPVAVSSVIPGSLAVIPEPSAAFLVIASSLMVLNRRFGRRFT